MTVLRVILPLLLAVSVSACATLALPFGPRAGAEAPAAGTLTPDADTPRPVPRPGEGAAAELPAPGGGETVATLGDPARPGLWLETGLVAVEGSGRVTTEAGRSIELTLIPSGGDPGGGSRLSLAAMQALGLPLTSLAPVVVEPI